MFFLVVVSCVWWILFVEIVTSEQGSPHPLSSFSLCFATSSQLAVHRIGVQLTNRTGQGARRLTVYLEGVRSRVGRRMQGVRLTTFGNRAVVGGADHGGVYHVKVNQGVFESGLVGGVTACRAHQSHWNRNHAGRNIGLGQTFLIHPVRILIVHGFQWV